MRAVQYRTIGRGPQVVEVETPEPGRDHVRLRVSAAGLCHSDRFVMELPQEAYGYGLPRTLGQEGAEIYCARAAELGITPPRLGSPGALAEYLLVDDVRGRSVVVP